MNLEVLLTEDGLRDPGDIYAYIAENHSQAHAERVLDTAYQATPFAVNSRPLCLQ